MHEQANAEQKGFNRSAAGWLAALTQTTDFALGVVYLMGSEHGTSDIGTVRHPLFGPPRPYLRRERNRVFTVTELGSYSGQHGSDEIYVAVKGNVYDSSVPQHFITLLICRGHFQCIRER